MDPAVTKYFKKIGAKGGRIGGLSTSPAKKKAAKLNGSKGGRPKKNKVKA